MQPCVILYTAQKSSWHFCQHSDLNKQQWACSTGSHTCPKHNTSSTTCDSSCGALDHELFLYFSRFLYPHHSERGFFLLSSLQRIWFQRHFFRCFLFFSVTINFHLVVNPACLQSSGCLLIVDSWLVSMLWSGSFSPRKGFWVAAKCQFNTWNHLQPFFSASFLLK